MNTGVLGNSSACVCRGLNSVTKGFRGKKMPAVLGTVRQICRVSRHSGRGLNDAENTAGTWTAHWKLLSRCMKSLRTTFIGAARVFCFSVLPLIEIIKCVFNTGTEIEYSFKLTPHSLHLHHTFTQSHKPHRYLLVSIQTPRWAGLAPLWKLLLFIPLKLSRQLGSVHSSRSSSDKFSSFKVAEMSDY